MQANQPDFMVFTGNANPALAAEIAQYLHISLGAAHVGRFSDGEVTVEVNQNVRARDVFVVQPTCAPTNENLMELLIMVDALKRALSAERITAVIPYFGYARQDRRPRSARACLSRPRWWPTCLRLGGRGPRADHGPARRPDPGLFRHSGGQHLWRPPMLLGDLRQTGLRGPDRSSRPDVGGVVRARAAGQTTG
jgi:ribose-phosphate pyrophosphokinase